MLIKEVIPVYTENRTKPINTLGGQIAELVSVKAGCNLRLCLKALTFQEKSEQVCDSTTRRKGAG
jgi:hypothetical protein